MSSDAELKIVYVVEDVESALMKVKGRYPNGLLIDLYGSPTCSNLSPEFELAPALLQNFYNTFHGNMEIRESGVWRKNF
jgi:hypothetical protein